MTEAAEAVTEAIVDTPVGANDESGIDMDAAVNEIGSGLGLNDDATSDDAHSDDAPADTQDDDTPSNNPADKAAAPAERPFPKAWAKETEELWKSIPDAAKAQIEKREQQMLEGLDQYKEHAGLGKSLKEVITPYQAMLTAHGVDAPKAVSFLLNAHYRLTSGTLESRQAAYAELGKNLGFSAAPADAGNAATGNAAEANPELKALKETVNRLESTMTADQERKLTETRAKVASEVNTFAEANPYFDEVADDMTPFLRAGADLKTAYEKAVWANPVTRVKELARTQEASKAELLKKSKDEAEAARRASSTNVRTRDSNRSPTEPKAKLFSADHDAEMREVVRKAGNRTH